MIPALVAGILGATFAITLIAILRSMDEPFHRFEMGDAVTFIAGPIIVVLGWMALEVAWAYWHEPWNQ